MSIDWNDTITVKTKDKKTSVIPRSAVQYRGTVHERDYSDGQGKDIEVTVIHVSIDWALASGVDCRHSDVRDKCIGIKLDMDLKIVLGLLRGSKAAETLF